LEKDGKLEYNELPNIEEMNNKTEAEIKEL